MTEQQLFGPYRLERVLGKGGSATVYLATHVEQGHTVALKVLPAELIDEFKTRFRREIAALARLRHENIVRILAVGRHRRRPYYAMEFLEGESLQDLLDRHIDAGGQGLDVGFALSLAISVSAALTHCHERGIWHRDVKPANIQVDDKGRVRLMDFGIAKFEQGGDITEVNKITGTPCYLSPEQLNGGTIDGRTDVYQLALVLYELVTGGPPFREGPAMYRAARRCREAIPPPSRYRSSLSSEFDDVLLTALAAEKEDRFETMASFRNALCEVRKTCQTKEGESGEYPPPVSVDDGDKVTAVLGEVLREDEQPVSVKKKKWRVLLIPLLILVGILLAPAADTMFLHMDGAGPMGLEIKAEPYWVTIKWQEPKASQSELVLPFPREIGPLRAVYGDGREIFVVGLVPGDRVNADLRLWGAAGRLLACTNIEFEVPQKGAKEALKKISQGEPGPLTLIELLANKKTTKAAKRGLQQLGWHQVEKAVNSALKSPSPMVRSGAISVLAFYRRKIWIVLKALKDRDLEVRREAFKALAHYRGNKQAFEAARKYIFVEDDPLLPTAIITIARIDGRRAVSVLSPLLQSVSRKVRIAAVSALVTVKDRRVYQLLWDLSLDEQDPIVRRELEKALRRLRLEQAGRPSW